MSLGMWGFFFKQKTAYEMRISDWSSDVCSSDLASASAVGSLVPVVRGSHRGLPVDRLGIVFGLAVLLLVLIFQALLEGVDALTHVTHQLRNLAAAAEQDQHNGQHDEPVPDTKTSHSGISHQIGRERSCAGLSQKGLAAAIFQRDRVNQIGRAHV